MPDEDSVRYEIQADASGLTTAMRQAARASAKSAAETEASAKRMTQAVTEMAAKGKVDANKLVKALDALKFNKFEIKGVFDQLDKLGMVTGTLTHTNQKMFAESTAASDRYEASLKRINEQIAQSGKLLNGKPLSASQIERMAQLRAQQGSDRNTAIRDQVGTGSFRAGNSQTSSEFLASQPAAVQNAFVKQQQNLNEADVKVTKDLARETSEYANSEHKLTRAIGDGLSTRIKEDTVLRAFQGNLFSGVRAAGAFIASLPGVSSAMASLFEVVGAFAVVGIFVDIASKVDEAIRKINEMPNAIHRGFGELNRASDLSVSSLELSNQKIRDRIALIEKKPVNGLADALDEARVKADQLAIALAGDDKAMGALLKTNSIGFIGELLGKASTKTVSNRVRGYNTELQKDSDAEADDTDKGDLAGAKAAHTKLLKDLKDFSSDLALDKALRTSPTIYHTGLLNKTGAAGTYAQLHGNQDANVAIDEGAAREYQNRLSQTTLEDDQTKLIGQEKAAENKVKGAQGAKTASENKLRGFQDQLQDIQDNGNIGAGDIYSFWQSKVRDFKNAPDQKKEVERSANEAYRQVSESNNAALASANAVPGGFTPNIKGFFGQQVKPANQQPVRPDDLSKSAPDMEGLRQDSQGAIENLHNLNQIPQIAQKAAISMREASLAIQVGQGQISRFGAATAQAKIHADDYATSMDRLKAALADINVNTAGLTVNQQAAARSGVQNQMAGLSNQNAVQVVQDSANIDQTHLTTAWKDSMNQFVQESEDAAKQIGNIFTSSIDSVNGTLANSMTAYYHTSRERWKRLRDGLGDDVRGAGTKVANYGLNNIEGSAAKLLGFGGKSGKADGSQSKPFYVRSVDGMKAATHTVSGAASSGLHSVGSHIRGWFGGGGSTFPSLLNTGGGSDPLGLNLPGGVTDDGTNLGTTSDTAIGASGIDKVGAGILGIGAGLLPKVLKGYANGGDIVGNVPAIVGEQGPEVFMPKSAGTIITNKQAFGNTTHNHAWNIDARGANDPAAVNAAVQRGIRQAAPHLVSASIAAGIERNKRLPSSAR